MPIGDIDNDMSNVLKGTIYDYRNKEKNEVAVVRLGCKNEQKEHINCQTLQKKCQTLICEFLCFGN